MSLKQHDEILDVFHGTSKRISQVISTTNLLLLNCYYPTQEFDSPKMNQPLAQFVYARGKRSPFITRDDAVKLLEGLSHLKACFDAGDFNAEMTHELLCGRIKISSKQIWFVNSGERYNNNSKNNKELVEGLFTALDNFINERGSEYPFLTSNKYENGVTTDSMFLLTHHGDISYGQIPSFNRYVYTTDGMGGQLTLQYGSLQLHLAAGHTRGVKWEAFLESLTEGLEKVKQVLENGSQHHTERLYKDHPVLGKYNCYISAITEYRGTFVVISTDLSCNNSKVSFTIEGDNFNNLIHFMKAITLYHKTLSNDIGKHND